LAEAGDKAFPAGAAVSEMLNDTPLKAEQKTRYGQRVTTLIENLSKLVIAAVNGFALGGGCELSMACTIRIAAETARFGMKLFPMRNRLLGDLAEGTPLLRIHSQSFTGEVLGSLRCDCRDQLEIAMATIAEEGSGLVIYEHQEGRASA
jgi:GTP cyclohydrolase II